MIATLSLAWSKIREKVLPPRMPRIIKCDVRAYLEIDDKPIELGVADTLALDGHAAVFKWDNHFPKRGYLTGWVFYSGMMGRLKRIDCVRSEYGPHDWYHLTYTLEGYPIEADST